MCAKGYRGILCNDCIVGYSKSSSYQKCLKCPGTVENIIRLVGLLIAMLVIIIIIVKSSLQYRYSQEKSVNISVLIRILMNHL